MLEELDEDFDRETEHMNAVMRNMARVFKTSSGSKMFLVPCNLHQVDDNCAPYCGFLAYSFSFLF